MGWGTNFSADIFLPCENYETKEQVISEIDDLKEQNQDYKERMLMLLVGGVGVVNTKDLEGNECDGVDVLHMKFTEILLFYTENIQKIYQLELLLENFESKELC